MGNLSLRDGRITCCEEGLHEVGGGGHNNGCRFATPGRPKRKGWSVLWMKGGSWRNGGIEGC